MRYYINLNGPIRIDSVFSRVKELKASLLVLFKDFFDFGGHRIPNNDTAIRRARGYVLMINIRAEYGPLPITARLKFFTAF